MANTFLLYGESGTYKTSNIGEMADYEFEKGHGITRLMTGDSGFAPVMDQVDRGIIHPWNVKASQWPMACVLKAAEGYWPTKWKNLEQGIADEASLKKDLSGVGMYAIEGLSMLGQLFKSDMIRKQRSIGEPLQGQTSKSGGETSYTDVELGTVIHVGASRGTFGYVQDRTYDYVIGFAGLSVHRLVITAHEGKGEDEKTKRLIFGPEVIGKAKTDKVPGWFENTFHFNTYSYYTQETSKAGVEKTKRTGIRAHFTRHPDSEVSTIFWPAKLSLTPRQLVAVNKKYPDGFFPLRLDEEGVYTSGMYQFLELLDSLQPTK